MKEIGADLRCWRERGDERVALAETPAETAVSILAEILAVRSSRSGGRLTETGGRIHAQVQGR